MAYASIDGENSHRQNKAFKQRQKVLVDSETLKSAYELADARLKQSLMTESQIKEFKQRLRYRLEQGCSLDNAFELASMKLRLVRQSSQHSDENNPQKIDQIICNFRLNEDEKSSDEISSDRQKSFTPRVSCEPTKDEILRVKEELIRKGLMTETPSETNSAETASFSSPAISQVNADRETSSGHSKDIALALDVLSGIICLWLILSMTAALPGAWYSTFPIALAIEFTPLLVFRAKINVERRWIPDLMGASIFVFGLLLYLAPTAQTVWNETRNYSSALAAYAHDVSVFEQMQSQIDKAKIKSESSESVYQATLKASGVTSWKTATAKKAADDDLKDLNNKIEQKSKISFPVEPKIGGELTAAAQTIATRIILFGAMFLLMFVRRKL